MRQLQASVDSAGTYGSPHLTHRALFTRISSVLEGLVRPDGAWLDIGAGHGGFVAIPARAGMRVVATEMADAALASLHQRFGPMPNVEVRAAGDDDTGIGEGERFDVVSMISVLHHIPDYLTAVSSLVDEHLNPGGSLVVYQDPCYYPTLSRPNLVASRLAYLSWRMTQGNVVRGLRTLLHWATGRLDPGRPSDMVEFHVVRQGVDERALVDLLRRQFDEVQLVRYWSSQGRLQQRAGALLGFRNTFGIVARARR